MALLPDGRSTVVMGTDWRGQLKNLTKSYAQRRASLCAIGFMGDMLPYHRPIRFLVHDRPDNVAGYGL